LFPERNIFLFNTVRWMGFRQADVTYRRRRRHAGETKWGWAQGSRRPSICSPGTRMPDPAHRMDGGDPPCRGHRVRPGPAGQVAARRAGAADPIIRSLLLPLLLLLAGIQLVMLGILGEYIWRILDQTQGRPRFIIDREIGGEIKGEKNDRP